LLLKCLDHFQKRRNLFDFPLFTQLLSLVIEELDLLVELVDLLVDSLLLVRIHFIGSLLIGVPASQRPVFRALERSLNFMVHLCNHRLKLLDELVLVLALVARHIGVIHELLLQVVIVALLARADVRFRVGEQVVWAEAKQIEFANLQVVRGIWHLHRGHQSDLSFLYG